MAGLLKRLPILLVGALAACSDGGPTDPMPVSRTAATVDRGTGIFTFDGVLFWECAGEEVRSVVYAPYVYHQVTTPTGEIVYHDRFITEEVTGTVTGLSTGRVWTRDRNVSVFIQRTTGGGMEHFTFKGTFVSETGPAIEVRETFHISRNAQGEITSQHGELRCL